MNIGDGMQRPAAGGAMRPPGRMPDPSGRPTPVGPRVVRVLLADPAAIYRRGLISVLRGEHDISVVAEAGDGDSAVALARKLAPDLVLLDASLLEGRQGRVDPWTEVRRLLPRLKICLLIAEQSSAPASVSEILRKLSPPAHGYLAKQLASEELAPAVRAVAAGKAVLSPVLASAFVPREGGTGVPQSAGGLGELTGREIEVLRLVAEGLSNRGIAARLYISENTVRNHVRHILEKLQLRSRTEAALHAVRTGVIDLDVRAPIA